MSSEDTKRMTDFPARVVLLVEDNPGDAEIVSDLLEESGYHAFRVVHTGRLAEALEKLAHEVFDVVLLDLRLPDAAGLETVEAVRSVVREVPIVVLTGTDDEELALSCIDAGAQDYLCKGEIKSVTLRRAIGYAVTRQREAQVRELQDLLTRYKALSSRGADDSVPDVPARAGALRERYPNIFLQMVRDYMSLLVIYIDQLPKRTDKPRSLMEHIVTNVGNAGGGPRDLIDVHMQALDEVVHGKDVNRSRAVAVEGRLLALEMMGLLVDYYRVGFHRRKISSHAEVT